MASVGVNGFEEVTAKQWREKLLVTDGGAMKGRAF